MLLCQNLKKELDDLWHNVLLYFFLKVFYIFHYQEFEVDKDDQQELKKEKSSRLALFVVIASAAMLMFILLFELFTDNGINQVKCTFIADVIRKIKVYFTSFLIYNVRCT